MKERLRPAFLSDAAYGRTVSIAFLPLVRVSPKDLAPVRMRGARTLRAGLLAAAGMAAAPAAQAQVSATWLTSPTVTTATGAYNYNSTSNWSPTQIPGGQNAANAISVGPATATFGATTTPAQANIATTGTSVGSFTLTSDASNYTITQNGALSLYDPGLIINGGSLKVFDNGFNFGVYGARTTLGNATIILNTGSVMNIWGGIQGITAPPNTTTAADANITINNQAKLTFFGTSSAGAATFNVNSGGTLQINDGTSGGTSVINLNGGTFDISFIGANLTTPNPRQFTVGAIHGNGSIKLGFSTLIVGSLDVDSDFAGIMQNGGGCTTCGIPAPGALAKIGTGTLTLSGANTYTGLTTIEAGAIAAAAPGTLPMQSAVIVKAPGTLELNGFNQSIGSLAGAGGVTLGSATLTTGNDNTNTEFSGVISGTGVLNKVGSGTFILSGAATFTGPTIITGGTLQLGDGTTNGSLVDNIVNNTTLIFDPAPGTTVANPGIISGSGQVQQIGAGITILTAVNTYAGPTTVSAGALVVGDPNTPTAALTGGGAITVASGGTFGGYGSVTGNLNNNGVIVAGNATPGFGTSPAGAFVINGTLANAGKVNLASDPIVGNVLRVTNYVGSNGALSINTVLGNDTSPTDQLVINGGTATGNTLVHVNNAGGPGALTFANGIPIVRAINDATTAAGAFTLNAPVVAGPFEYDLFHGSADSSAPNDWFLRSTVIVPPSQPVLVPPSVLPTFPRDPPPKPLPPGVYPIVGPRIASYGVVQPIARQMGMTILGTLHERIGDTLTIENAGTSPVEDFSSVWGRIIGEQVHNSYRAFAAPSAAGQILGFQGGLDLLRRSGFFSGGREAAGIDFAFSNANLGVDGLVTNEAETDFVRVPTGALHLNAYTFGGYWTHYDTAGWYLDAVIQGTIYAGRAEAQFSEFNFTSSLPTDGSGIITSLEGGYPVALDLGPLFVLEPQAQIMWQRVRFNPRDDGLQTVGLGRTTGATGRLGMRAQWTITDEDGEVWQPYARFNIWRAWGGNAETDFADSSVLVPLVEQATWAEVAGGVSVKYDDSISLFAQAGYRFALSNKTTISGFKASIGPRLTW